MGYHTCHLPTDASNNARISLRQVYEGIFLAHSVAIALIPQREHYDVTVTVTQKGSIWNWNWFASVTVSVFRNPLRYESVWTGAKGMSAEFPTLDLRPMFRLRLNRSNRTLSCLAIGLDIRSRKEPCKSHLALYKLQYKIALHGCYAADICSYRRFWTTFRSHLQRSSSPIFLALGWSLVTDVFWGNPTVPSLRVK